MEGLSRYISVVEKNYPADDRAGKISRARLEAVIRRAAELYAAESDADDSVSEAELIRIASELGLPSRFVRQALYETPGAPVEPSVVDRLCGPAQVSVARVVPNEPDLTFKRLEEYLVTREYLQVVRRQPGRAWFIPAEDLVSRIIRSITRPSSRHLLARTRGVALAVHPLEEGRSHVRLELNLASLRKEFLVVGGVVGGGPIGITVGAIGAAIVDSMAGPLGTAGIFAALGAGMIASASAGIGIAARAFRGQRKTAAGEAESLLDRIETGDRLDPPLPPWRQKLQSRLFRSPLRP